MASNNLKAKVKVPVNTPSKTKKAVKKVPLTGSAEGYDLWARRVTSALQWRMNHWNGDQTWRAAYKMYRGDHWENKFNEMGSGPISSDNPNSRITVNLTGSTILNLVPFLINRKVEYVCNPNKPDSEVQAKIQTAVLNYEVSHGNYNAEIKKSVADCLIAGHGIIKTSYTLEVDESVDIEKHGEITYNDFVVKDSANIRRISPFLFLQDPNSKTHDLSGARWCAEIFFSPRSELIVNQSYSESVRQRIADGDYEPSSAAILFLQNPEDTLSNNLNSSQAKYDVPEDELIVLYEIWDKRYRKVIVMADGCEEPLLVKDWPYDYLREFPYCVVEFIPVPDEIYPLGIPYFIADQQFELNRVRTQMFDHRRRFNRKYQALDTVDPDESAKLTDSPDGTVIKVPVIGAISPIQDAALSQDVLLNEQVIKQDIQDLTGADALFRGGSLPSRTTAGEINTRSMLFRQKLDARADAIDDWVLQIGRQTLRHIQGNYFVQKVVQIVGEQGKYWVEASIEDIQAETEITMETVSAPKSDPQLERQQALQMFQICMQFLPFIQQGIVNINVEELLAWILQKFGMKDTGRFFKRMLTPNAPLVETPASISNNLNAAGLPGLNQNTQEVSDLRQEGGLASILNQSGLQL